MTTVTRDFVIAASPEKIWDALRDFHAVHQRVVPGFLTAATQDGDDRILTFFNGFVTRERLVGLDDTTRRIAYTHIEGRFAYHAASVQVFPHEFGSRVVWITDMLPDTMADSSRMMMDHGVAAMVRTLADEKHGGPD
jgi:carbon monoxide dehydrogenase subunit G